ncbi:putative GPI-anchored protein, partial [Ananas comosus]
VPAEPAPLLLLPPLVSSTPTTIPAFPEQSAVSSACPLRPPDGLLPAVSSSCSSSSPSSSHCCPVLAAWLYAAYAPTALSLSPLPPAAAAAGGGGVGGELPLLPDDSESCAAAAARALRSRGGPAASLLPRIDSCAVRLRRPSCPPLPLPPSAARWSPPTAAAARRLQRACSAPGLAACSRCLRALNQLKAEAAAAVGGNATATMKSKAVGRARGRDCQIMGLTWLLAKNGTRYLPAAAAVLRTFMAADKAPRRLPPGAEKRWIPPLAQSPATTTCPSPSILPRSTATINLLRSHHFVRRLRQSFLPGPSLV